MSESDERKREIVSYAVGFGLALAATAAAFALVLWPSFAAETTLGIVFALALLQMCVHFRRFLHISLKRSSRDDLQLILFSTLIVALMVSGTLVILFKPARADDVMDMSKNERYDLIVIGSGPGGASLAHRLAPTGKRILILERGDYLPREEANWSAKAVFVEGRYQAPETWIDAQGGTFSPALHYYVGGNSKVYGAALFRLRVRDFDEVVHAGGVSPAWPLKYDAFERYYDEAEALFHVHGDRGEDPLEPSSSKPYPFAPVKHEPKVAELSDKLTSIGLRPFLTCHSASCSTRRTTASRRRPASACVAVSSTGSHAC